MATTQSFDSLIHIALSSKTAIHTARPHTPTSPVLPLENVSEVIVLLVRQIAKARRILLHALLGREGRKLAVLLAVLILEREPQDDKDAQLDNVGDEERADAELVLGCLAREVKVGRDNVANAGA